MRKLTQTNSDSSKTVLTIVVILVAGVIATAVGVFLTVRFLEKRRRLRGDAAIEAGKSMNKKNARHKRRFSQTEYDTVPLSDNVRKRRFSTGHDVGDRWGNLMDVTLPDDDEYHTPDVIVKYDDKTTEVVIDHLDDDQISDVVYDNADTNNMTKVVIDDGIKSDITVNVNSDDNTIKRVVIEQIDDKQTSDADIYDTSDSAKPVVVDIQEDDFDGIPMEICDPHDLRDICNVADIPGSINLYSGPILNRRPIEHISGHEVKSLGFLPQKSHNLTYITLSEYPILNTTSQMIPDGTSEIPPELTNSDLHIGDKHITQLSLQAVSRHNCVYNKDFPKSHPVDITESSFEESRDLETDEYLDNSNQQSS